jgi:hypothetical protein
MTMKKILWGIAIVFILFVLIQTIQLFFINGTVWKHRRELEKTLFLDPNTSYEPRLKAEIMQTEAYRKFKETKVMDSLRIYLRQASDEGKARLKSKDSIPR